MSEVTLQRLQALKPVIERLAARRDVREVCVFGSVARGEAQPDSDIDLLVTPGESTTLFDISHLELDLERLLGRAVCVMSRPGLDPVQDQAIVADAISL